MVAGGAHFQSYESFEQPRGYGGAPGKRLDDAS